MTARKIIVGYDGSCAARDAARWALDHAARTGAPVEFCFAHEDPAPIPAAAMVSATTVRHGADLDDAVEDMIEDIAASAANSHPDVTVDTVIKRASPVDTLTDRSADADLIVLGSRAYPAGTGALARAVTMHAKCSVVVTRGKPERHDPIVVGVDSSATALLALDFAFDRAAAHDATLRVVRAWLPHAAGPSGLTAATTEPITAVDWRSLNELVDQRRRRFPTVKAAPEVVVDHAARALTEASAQAQLVVVGTRGHAAFRGALLGSVSQHLLHHSLCTVAIVRDNAAGTA